MPKFFLGNMPKDSIRKVPYWDPSYLLVRMRECELYITVNIKPILQFLFKFTCPFHGLCADPYQCNSTNIVQYRCQLGRKLFVKPFIPKVGFKHTQNVFQDIPESPSSSKNVVKKKPKGDHSFPKKRGVGGPARYDHDHRFNVFF